MSSSSRQSERYTLEVKAPDRATRIEVLDGDFHRVPLETNLGHVRLELPGGAYAVRFQRGGATQEKVIVLSADTPHQNVTLHEEREPLLFATAAPLSQTSTTHEWQQEPATLLSHANALPIPADTPGGGHLLLFARDPFIHARESLTGDVADGITLHDADGQLLADFAAIAKRKPEDGWAGSHLKLAPGAYRLRLSLPGPRKHSERMVYVCRNWQTQVFLMADGWQIVAGVPHADFRRVSILMCKPGRGFDDQRPDMRRTEIALEALSEKRNVPSELDPMEAQEQALLAAKFENPMLGLYGALLYLRRPSLDADLLCMVFENLCELVGPLPDVEAIGRAIVLRFPAKSKEILQRLDQKAGLRTPPMLRESWGHLIVASAAHRELIPRGSLAERVAACIASRGPWLTWLGEPPPASEAAPEAVLEVKVWGIKIPDKLIQGAANLGLELLLPGLFSVLVTSPDATGKLLDSETLTPSERRLARVLCPLADPQLKALAGSSVVWSNLVRESESLVKDPAAILERLQLPASTAIQAAWGLMTKLRESMASSVLPDLVATAGFVSAASRPGAKSLAAAPRILTDATALRHKGSGRSITNAELLYLSRKGSPSTAAKGPLSSADIATMLRDAGFVRGADQKPITTAAVDQALKSLKFEMAAAGRAAVGAQTRSSMSSGTARRMRTGAKKPVLKKLTARAASKKTTRSAQPAKKTYRLAAKKATKRAAKK